MRYTSTTTAAGGRLFHVAALLLLPSAFLLPVVTSSCPTSCTCLPVSGGVRVNCRRGGIVEVSDVIAALPANAVELDLGDNPISYVNRMSFLSSTYSLRVRSLQLDRCRLSRVEQSTFYDLGSTLEFLDLSDNNIESLLTAAFDGLRSLRRLRLDGNKLGASTSAGLPSSAFHGLKLDELRLDKNELTTLPDGLFDACNVTQLNLDRNILRDVTTSSMAALRSSLRRLTISNNGDVSLRIADDAFSDFSFQNLTISSSGLTGVKFLEGTSSVEVLDVSGNELGSFSLKWSSPLKLSVEVRLSRIGLTAIDDALTEILGSVRILDLSGNRISGRVDAAPFRKTVDLRNLDLSDNAISSLSSNFVRQLPPRVQTLNLSGNALTYVDQRHLADADRLTSLDLSRNRIWVFPESLQPVFDASEMNGGSVFIDGNPIHCNCESRWLRRWIQTVEADVAPVLCASPPSMVGPLADRAESDFVCRTPNIASITRSMNVLENTSMLLSCSAEGDPAPDVIWSSQIDSSGVTASPDRTQYRTQAIWGLTRIRRIQAGWYACNVSNIVGWQTKYSYVHVLAAGEPLINLTGLVYPMSPISLTDNSTVDDAAALRNITTSGLTTSTPSTQRAVDESPTTISVSTTTGSDVIATSSVASTIFFALYSGSEEITATSGMREDVGDAGWTDEWRRVMLIVGVVAAGCLLVAVIIIAVVCIVRCCRRRREARKDELYKRRRGYPSPREDRIRFPIVPGVSLAPSGGDASPGGSQTPDRWRRAAPFDGAEYLLNRNSSDQVPAGAGTRVNGDGAEFMTFQGKSRANPSTEQSRPLAPSGESDA